MSASPVSALAMMTSSHGTPIVRNRVLLVLVLAALPAALGLAFVSVAPNRLVSGSGVPLYGLTSAGRHALWLPPRTRGAA